jgi:serine/threonine protein phosphatase PrpC
MSVGAESTSSSLLSVTIAQRSEAGRKSTNEDSMGALCPEDPTVRMHKGVVAVVCDGVSSAEAGREAAEVCVQNFLSDYYSTPETWTVETAAGKVLTSINSWLYQQGARASEQRLGYVCTLSALVLKSRTAYVLHIGDTRVSVLRAGRLRPLTRDHTVRVGDNEKYLSRAMGFDTKVEVDWHTLPLEQGDLFLLSSDGVHDHIDSAEVEAVLSSEPDLDRACGELLRRAHEHGSADNLTCQLLRVDALPDTTLDEYLQHLSRLPFPPELSPGMELDGLRVVSELHASSRSQLYLVDQLETGRRLVMKTPSVNYEDDPAYIERFLLEHWLGQHVNSLHLLRSVAGPLKPSCLYSLREYVPGQTLRQWLDVRFSRSSPKRDVAEVVRITGLLVRGLIALHRREILHQDLKPANIVLGADGNVTIIDFGSCYVAGVEEITTPIVRDKILGTASYAAPEYWLGVQPDARSDLYSLGCICYEMLTGELPYGAAIEDARTVADFKSLRYVPAHRKNPHVPLWMDRALERAVKLELGERYKELTEFIYDLENPNPEYLAPEHPELKVAASSPQPWKVLALVLLVTQAITLLLWLLR